MVDWTGIALVIGAVTVFITSVGGFVLSAITLVRGARREKKLDVVHDLVNGQSKKLEELSFEKGVRKGGDAERKNPTAKK